MAASDIELLRFNPANADCTCGFGLNEWICSGCRDLAPFVLHEGSDTGRMIKCINPDCVRAGGESAAKLSPPPAAIDPSMKLKELRVLLHPNVLRLAKTAAAYDDVSMPVWIAQALKAHLERYPF